MFKEPTSEETPKSGGGGNGGTTIVLVDVAVFCGEAESLTVSITEKEPEVVYA